MSTPRTPPPKLSKAFGATTSNSTRNARGDAATLTQIAAIEARAGRVKAKAREHFSKHSETWVAKEAVRIWRARAGLALQTVPNSQLGKEIVASGIIADARRNVYARINKRLTTINEIKTRLSNAAVRNLNSPQLSHRPTQAMTRAAGKLKKGSPTQ